MGKLMFGKLAPKEDKRTLMLGSYFNDNLPPPPLSVDKLAIVYSNLKNNEPHKLFPMDGNDVMGDCTIAGIAHAVTVYDGLVGHKNVPCRSAVVRTYRRLSGGVDSGLVMLDVLNYWRTHTFGKEKILAFAKIDLRDRDHVKHAINLFGGVYLGFNVQQNAVEDFEAGKIWDKAPLDSGGHAVFAAAYDKDSVTVLTWGGVQKGTWGWWDRTVDEAYAILPVEAKHVGFTPGFEFEQLMADLNKVTR